MTIRTLIDKVNDEKPSSFGTARLLAFINEIEADVAEQLHSESVPVYTEADMDTELIAPAPYDRLYVSYVKSQIDYANEELESYANNQVQHVQDFHDFIDWVVRTDRAANDDQWISRFRNIF